MQPVTSKRQSFLQGALLLASGVMLVKVVGALYKVPLSSILQEDGMGYFSTAYSVYNVLFSLATAGFPVAVSHLVAQRTATPGAAFAVRRAAFPLFLCTGLLGTVLMLLLAPLYCRWLQNFGALPALVCLAPSLLLCTLSAVYRGYYEGLGNMLPTTLSQVIEAAGKLIFGLSASAMVMQLGAKQLQTHNRLWGRTPETPEQARLWLCGLGAGGAIFGVTVGAVAGLLFLRHYDRRRLISQQPLRKRQKEHAPAEKPLRRCLLRMALPLSVGAVATSLSGLVDASFLQTRLSDVVQHDCHALLAMYGSAIPQSHLEDPRALPNYLFGCYNMALTLFMIVPSVTQSFAVSALPSVTRAAATHDPTVLHKSIQSVLRTTCIFAVPAGLGLSALAEPIARLVYGSSVGTPVVAKALQVMGIASIFASITTPLGSILQALGKMELPVILVLLGLCVKVVLNYILVGIPEINLLGGGISTAVSYLLVAVAQGLALRRFYKGAARQKSFFPALLFSACCCTAAAWCMVCVLTRRFGAARWIALPGVAAGAVVYAVFWLRFLFSAASEKATFRKRKTVKISEKHLKKQEG